LPPIPPTAPKPGALGPPIAEGEPKAGAAGFACAGVVDAKGWDDFGRNGGVEPRPGAPKDGTEGAPKVAAGFANKPAPPVEDGPGVDG